MKIFACFSLVWFLFYTPAGSAHINQKNLNPLAVIEECRNIITPKTIKSFKSHLNIILYQRSLAELLLYQFISLALIFSLFHLSTDQ